VAEHYDRLARHYDAALHVWRSLVAGPAWEVVGDLLAEHVRPGATVLDAGTGTGAAVRLLLERANPGRVTAVDVSKGMLRTGRKSIADQRVLWEQQDITALPYADRTFDVVVSTWVLETLDDPRAAVGEFLRVIKDDGIVIYAFSSRPEANAARRLYGRLLEEWSAGTLHGHFVALAERPYHTCEHSQLATVAGGLAPLVVLRKCCRVDDPAAPCLPTVTGMGAEAVEHDPGREQHAHN
jgi:ubiquinone/menaquinone biosynthesis C-methylase UbiE